VLFRAGCILVVELMELMITAAYRSEVRIKLKPESQGRLEWLVGCAEAVGVATCCMRLRWRVS
jgi:hypothetical protein